jgi:hypothetical protein
MGEVKNVVANFSSDVEVFSVLVGVCYVDAGDKRGILSDGDDWGSCHKSF